MDYNGDNGGDWASFVDDRGSPYWVHPATGESTYSNPYGGDHSNGEGYLTQNDDDYGYEGYSGGGYSENEGYVDDGSGGFEGYNEGAGYGYGNENANYLGGDVSNDSGWCERKRVTDAIGLAAASVKASRGGGMAPGLHGNNSNNTGIVADSTSLAFDHMHELLWVGRADGSVSSFALDSPAVDGSDSFVVSNRYSAYKQCTEGSVLALASLHSGPLSLSQHRVRIHARGGFALCEAPAGLAARSSSSLKSGSSQWNNSSGSSSRSGNGGEADLPQPRMAGGGNGSHGWQCMRQLDGQEHRLAVGAASGLIHVLDMRQGLVPIGVADVNDKSPLSAPGSSAAPAVTPGVQCLGGGADGRFLVCGGADGKVRVLDPSLRSSQPITKTFDAYTGSVTCIDVKNYMCTTLGANLNRNTITTGPGGGGAILDPRTGRFVASTKKQQVADSVVKVFDLRTNRQLPPAQFMGGGGPGGSGLGGGSGGGAPTFLSFLPSFSSTLFAASPNGALRLIEARGTDPTQYFQAFGDDGASSPRLTCGALSSSGDWLALGLGAGATMNGSVSLWSSNRLARVNMTSSPDDPPFEFSRPQHDRDPRAVPGSGGNGMLVGMGAASSLHVHALTPQPPLSYSVDNPCLAGRYTLKLPYHHGPWPLDAESVSANALSGLPPVPGFDSVSTAAASTKKKTNAAERHRNAYALSSRRGVAPAPRRSVHPAVLKGMQPTATDAGRPMSTLALRKLLPHFWPPFSEEAPNMAGLDRGKLAKEVWIDQDPRNAEATSQGIIEQHRRMLRALRIAANGGIGAGATPVKAPNPNKSGDDDDDGNGDDVSTAANPFLSQIPAALRPATVVLGKYGFVDESQYAERNEVNGRFSGLDNFDGHPAAYTNAIVQLLFHVPELQATVLREQYNPANFAHGRGLAVELAFLFHMLSQTAAAAAHDGIGRCARPTNFLAAFKRVPRIVALGLGGGNPSGDASSSGAGAGGSGSNGSGAGGTAAEAMAAAAAVAAGAVDARALGRDSGTAGTAAVAKAALAAAAAVTEDSSGGGGGGMTRSNSGGNLSSLFNQSDGGLGSAANSSNTATSKLSNGSGGAVALAVRAEAFHRFLVTEFDHELSELGAFTESGKPVKSRGSAAAAAAAADNSSSAISGALAITGALSESYGTLLESMNSFVNPAFSADDTTTLSQTLMFDLVYPDPVILTAAIATATKVPRPLPPPLLYTQQQQQQQLSISSAAATSVAAAPVSFAELLRSSLCVSKKSTARSETAAAQGYPNAYQKIIQRKDPKSLPKVLALHANLHGHHSSDKALKSLWQRTNALGGAWLPRKLQVLLEPHKSSSGEPRVEVAEFVEPIPEAGVQGQEEGGAGVRQGCWSCVSSSRIHGDPARWLETENGLADQGGAAGAAAGVVREAEARAKAIASLAESNKKGANKNKTSAGGDAEDDDDDAASANGNASSTAGKAAGAAAKGATDATNACQFRTYELVGLVSQVRSGPSATCDGHLVTHVREAVARGASNSGTASSSSSASPSSSYSSAQAWVSFNDFAVAPCTRRDALAFHEQIWREPCVLVYRACNSSSSSRSQSNGDKNDDGEEFATPETASDHRVPVKRGRSSSSSTDSISDSVFELPSLAAPRALPSAHTSAAPPPLPPPSVDPPTFRTPDPALGLPGAGDVVAIDTEFVSVGEEEGVLNADGTRTVVAAARQVLARVSAIDGRTGEVMIDDYVLPSEPVVDFKTRFSGLVADDLDPYASRHHLVHQRTAYLKLRLLVDRGATFVGHGLKTDFAVCNLFVPPAQVGDTLDLWALPHQRKLSLRLLAGCLLGSSIQGEVHDSIEDARTALRLFELHRNMLASENGREIVANTLESLYQYGAAHDWKFDANDPFELPQFTQPQK